MITLQDCQAHDRADPLAPLRAQFDLPDGVIYLDGNSLGALPRATAERVQRTLRQEWGQDLIQSWNSAGWFAQPLATGDKIARLIGAGPNQVVAADTTSVNLYKALSAAIGLARAADPARRRIVSERSNFPTDLYIAEALCREHGMVLQLVHADELPQALDEQVAVLMLTHVHYRSGRMHDMAALNARAQALGILTVWDLAHSAGAVPVDLLGSGADFAVGCGYKYLNGGPGAPAFVWLNPRHHAQAWQPLAGWWGHARPFGFSPHYEPAPGIARFQCGTQPMLSLVALDAGVDTVLAAEALGGMAALRRKSLALTELFMQTAQDELAGHGVQIVTPQDPAARGSQVSLVLDADGYAVMQALIAHGVIGDYRAGDPEAPHPEDRMDLLRFGMTPLYLRHTDVWQAVQTLRQILDQGLWRDPRHARRHAVT